MKIVQLSSLILAATLVVGGTTARAVEGPVFHEAAPDPTPAPAPAAMPEKAPAAPKASAPKPTPKEPAKEAPAKTETAPVTTAASDPTPEPKHGSSKYETVDQIKGIGSFKFGAHFKDFAPGLLRIIDPRAKGVMLRVCPYGDNYLVTDLKDMTWGGIPIAGLIATFHDDYLIDLQVALKAKKIDFYFADRAFKEKYGQSEQASLPVETWHGSRIRVTMILLGADLADPNALDAPTQGKIELLDSAQWNKVDAAHKAEFKQALDKRYQDAGQKVKANL